MPEALEPPAALADLLVVELGEGIAPAYCGKWLAAFGAQVIKVEPPAGDWMRSYRVVDDGPAGPESGALFAYLNTGKQSLTLDLAAHADQSTLQQLLRQADLLVHDLSPARLHQVGLDVAALRSANPSLVAVAILPFGSDGPYAHYAATSIVLLALGGYQYLTGEPGREPLALPGFQPEYLAAHYAIVAALAGILDRRRRGRGCTVELSMLEVMASLHQFTVSQYLTQGTIRSRHGNRWENNHPLTLLPCRDGFVAVCLPSQELWERLCRMMNRPDLIDDPRFATGALRHANADALDDILVAWLRRQEKREFFRRAQEEWRLPAGPLFDLGEVLRDAQLAARRFWVKPDGAADGPLQPGLPVTMTATPWSIRRSPRLGEHTHDIVTRLAGAADPMAPRERTSDAPNHHVTVPDAVRGRHLPLAGIRVLDLTRVWSGPLCTRILADLGAEVIKLERPLPLGGVPGAIPTDLQAAARGGPGKHHRNKLSVAIDLGRPEGRELVMRLVATADVLVENFSARVMPNFGLDFAALQQVNPLLIVLAMPGFGGVGPYREYLAYGPSIEPMTGLSSLLGYPGEAPMVSAIAYPDAVAGVNAAAAVLVALVARRRLGVGQFLELSQLEATTTQIGEYLLAYQVAHTPPERLGNGHPVWAPHGTYRCRGEDEWVSIAVRSDEEWACLCRATGLTALLAQPAYATAAGRRAHHRQLDAAIGAWTAGRDKFEAMERLQRAGVPAGAVLNAKDLLENPQLAHRGFFVEATGRDGEPVRMPGTPIRIDGWVRDEWHAAPAVGEHTVAVLRDLLGLSEAAIAALAADGTVGVAT